MINFLRRTLAFLFVFALCLVLFEAGLYLFAGLSRNARAEKNNPGTRRITCLGDSFTFGLGAPAGKDYPGELERLLRGRAEVINRGRPGANTHVLLRSLPSIIESDRPDVVILLAGLDNGSDSQGFYAFLSGAELGFWERAADLFFGLRTVKSACVAMRRAAALLGRGSGTDAAADSARILALDDEDALLAEIAARPREPLAYRVLARLYFYFDGDEKALNFLHESIRKVPDLPELYGYLADIQLELGREESAVGAVFSGIRNNPGGRRFYDNSLGVFRRVGSPEALRMISEGFSELAPRHFLAREFAVIFESGAAGLEDRIGGWVLSDLNRIIRLCRAAGVKVVLQNYPCPGGHEFELRDFARSRSIVFVDQFAAFNGPSAAKNGLFDADGRCSAAGYALMAQNVAQVLDREGLAGSSSGRGRR